MRPLRLRVKGFTAFRDEQNIDFTELDVFAIAGETGSGKSSILDAMTYALFGYVERVGRQVGQLVSQGQPRLAVTLEFAVGADRYRITRSTPARTGATKVMLERADGDGWVQHGEGADRVRESNEIVRRLIGLDYTAFTRSVLLPQGRFAEFLTGDPKERRDILTELLGLSIFERMAKHANQLGKEERLRAESMRELLDREYAGVTAEAAKDARRGAKAARARERKLAGAGAKVLELLERYQSGRRAAGDLLACVSEARTQADRFREVGASLLDLADRMQVAGESLALRETEMKRAEGAARKAADDVVAAEERWGTATEIAALRELARGLAAVSTRVERARGEREGTEAAVADLEKALAASSEQLSVAAAIELQAQEALQAAVERRELAMHEDLAASLSAGLKKGDPCPVCGQALSAPPKRPAPRAVQAAASGVTAAEREAKRSANAHRDAERLRDTAARDLHEARTTLGRLEADITRDSKELEEAGSPIAAAFEEGVPLDPVAVLSERISALEGLAKAERLAVTAAEEATRARDAAEREVTEVRAEIAADRARLEFDVGPLVQRARRATNVQVAVPRLPRIPASTAKPEALAAHAEKTADGLDTFSTAVEERVAGRSQEEAALLDKARALAGEVGSGAEDLPTLAAELNDGIRRAGEEAATAEQSAETLDQRLATRATMEEEASARETRGGRLRALAAELRADHVIAFLQAEALQVLAAAGSERLATLSGGRYRLTCAGDEFSVVDTWNGDEERSVRTLSGGETFLASLCLALALSEQVRSLSVTERARLDSLFLDEGFGTLDPEALRIVVDAIEQLAGDGRLVGVITHVRELAEQFPRLEIRKSQRGSTVEFVA
ncbi:MAG: AAA family ATPase [Actinomycetota bacterium]